MVLLSVPVSHCLVPAQAGLIVENGAVQEVDYFLDSSCIFSRFIETRFIETVRKYHIMESVRISFTNFSDAAIYNRWFLAYHKIRVLASQQSTNMTR